MNWTKQITAAALPTFVAMIFFLPSLLAIAAEGDDKAREQFEEILDSINERSFVAVKSAINKNNLASRIYGIRVVDPEVRRAFEENFWEMVESIFLGSQPNTKSDAAGEIISFEFQDGKGQATVRYKLPKFAYAYQVWQLQYNNRQQLRIVDWNDTGMGQEFSAEVGEALVTVMPSRVATRRLLSSNNPTDRQLFQVTEILKAARDGQPPRFFEIYDDLEPELQEEALLAKFSVVMARIVKDGDRFARALEVFSKTYGNDPAYGLMLSDAYLLIEDYEKSYASLVLFHEGFGVDDGAIPARLSALALALGNTSDADKYALEATSSEPSLELGWWSLLRARSKIDDFQGAVEVLAYLEDNFDHRFDVAKLRRDPYHAFTNLSQSQEFKDWHASRP